MSYAITPASFERNLARPAFTKMPMMYPAAAGITASDNPPCAIEFTFAVELAGPTGGAWGSTPPWDVLLKSCGLTADAAVFSAVLTSIADGPIRHRESISSTATHQAISTHFTGDTRLYYDATGAFGSTTVTGTAAVSDDPAVATLAATTEAARGPAYYFDTTKSGGANNCSATIALYLNDRTGASLGRIITAKGCRGSVIFEMRALDRCIMRFTMQGVLHEITDASDWIEGVQWSMASPPIFQGAAMKLRENTGSTDFTSPIFDTLTIDLGNTLTLRTDAQSANGYKCAYITDRNPTITFNPDAIKGGNTSSSVYDFFEKFVMGTESRMSFQLGEATDAAMDGNSFHFKMPAIQWTGVSDGDRDQIAVYECTGALTGGTYGDAANAAGDDTLADGMGADNEFVLICT